VKPTLILLVLVTWSCSPDPEKPFLGFSQPEHFPATRYTFTNNPVTKDGFELGRMLFYDPVLSRDSTISCSTCHLQATAFADPVHKISVGIDQRIGTRNAPPIFNLAFKTSFFWDGGVTHIDFIPLNAIANPNELDESMEHVVEKLKKHFSYPAKFNKAFHKEAITSQQVLFALAQFTTALVSASSRYDQYVTGNTAVLNEQEVNGLTLFEEKCSACHPAPLFTNENFVNNGLDEVTTDKGRATITESNDDLGKFQVPSLRNVELTDPYMHDGRFRTLDQVLTHYQSKVSYSATLDPLLQNQGVLGIVLTDQDKADLIAFLKTLTDTKFTHDNRLSNPFLK
jgi:cytochrome c peroxidase